MVTIRTTRLYLNIFGKIQSEFKQIGIGSQKHEDAFEHVFQFDDEFFRYFQKANIIVEAGVLRKGKTVIGKYDRPNAKFDRPRPRWNTTKFKDTKRT